MIVEVGYDGALPYLDVTMPRLIDAGKSRRGWSRIGNFNLCEYLAGAIEQRAVLGSRDALCKGSLGHVGQAHLHTIEGVEHWPVLVNGELLEDASDLATPEQAIVMLANSVEEYRPFKQLILDTHREYLKQRQEGVGHAIMVEQELVGVLGVNKGLNGFWLVDPCEWDRLDPQEGMEAPKTLRAHDGSTITVAPLDVIGHERHGWPIYLSRRLDLVRRKGRWGEIMVEDHKFKQRIGGRASKDAYRADDGFTAIDILSRQQFGIDYGGIVLNLISVNVSSLGEQNRVRLPPAIKAEQQFPFTLYWREHNFARLQMMQRRGELPYEYWPSRKSENGSNCVSRYGKCHLYNHCYNGEALQFEKG